MAAIVQIVRDNVSRWNLPNDMQLKENIQDQTAVPVNVSLKKIKPLHCMIPHSLLSSRGTLIDGRNSPKEACKHGQE